MHKYDRLRVKFVSEGYRVFENSQLVYFYYSLQFKETHLLLTMATSNDNSIVNVNNINVLDNNDDASDDFIMENLCVECNVDMGYCNPRQLFGKTRCDYSNEEDVPVMKKRKKNSPLKKLFMSMEKFMEHVKVSQATKWTDLDKSKIYRVTEVEEVAVKTANEADESKRMAKVGTFEDSDGEVVRVWLPGIVAKELTCINLDVIETYIRSLGPKISKTGRTYHNFKIVKKE